LQQQNGSFVINHALAILALQLHTQVIPLATANPELQLQPNNDEPCHPIVPVLDENTLNTNVKVKERDAGGGLSALVRSNSF